MLYFAVLVVVNYIYRMRSMRSNLDQPQGEEVSKVSNPSLIGWVYGTRSRGSWQANFDENLSLLYTELSKGFITILNSFFNRWIGTSE